MPDFTFIEDESLRKKAEEAHEASIAEFNKGVDDKINEAISGLKSKNEELLNEKKKIQNALKNFENLDPEKAKEALKFLEENEYAQMLKDGKVDEILEKKTSQMRSDHEAAINELTSKLTETEQSSVLYKTKYETKVIEDNLRAVAIKAGVRKEAVDDILMRGLRIFTLDDSNGIEARDKDGKLVKTKDDKVLTAQLWIEDFKETAPHYFPGSEGAGAHGGGSGKNDLSIAMQKAADKGDMAEYRRLREKARKK